MKTILGWLSDPFLHLLGIAAILLVIGSQMKTESNTTDDTAVVTRCEVCHKVHDLSKACRTFVSRETVSVRR